MALTCRLLTTQSELAKVDVKSGDVVKRLKGIGTKAHSIVKWGPLLLVLDSDSGALIRVDPETGATTQLWKVGKRSVQHCYLPAVTLGKVVLLLPAMLPASVEWCLFIREC